MKDLLCWYEVKKGVVLLNLALTVNVRDLWPQCKKKPYIKILPF